MYWQHTCCQYSKDVKSNNYRYEINEELKFIYSDDLIK